MLARFKTKLHAPDRFKRLAHYIFAGILFRLPVSLRKRWFAGEGYYCPVCETHLKTFLTLHRPYHRWCPVCQSLQRPRLGWLFLNSPAICISEQPMRMLHIAPEPALAARLRRLANLDYLSADLLDPQAMVKMDITDIHFPGASFDLIYCSHVLEHVQDDRKALNEFWRVLKPGGKAILLVPIFGETTLEDPRITNPADRERIFGQHDHVRVYGLDFVACLEATGFEVKQIRPQALGEEAEIEGMGLPANEIIFLSQKPE